MPLFTVNKQPTVVTPPRQSILKRAFAGKLVPQNPNDEPAARLLERIMVEKTNLTVKKAGKGGKQS